MGPIQPLESMENMINAEIRKPGIDTNLISDGYHTFGELYEHRIALFIALCHVIADDSYQPANKRSPWKSRLHSDGTQMDGWFIAGIGVFQGEQITYHLPDRYWDMLQVREFEKAPQWDGHRPADVVERLLEM